MRSASLSLVQRQQRELDRIGGVDEHLELVGLPVTREKRVTPAAWWTRTDRSSRPATSVPASATRLRRNSSSRKNQASACGSTTGSFANERQPVLAVVLAPRMRRARRSGDRPQIGFGDDVRPRGGVSCALQHHRVLAAGVGEAAEAVGESFIGESAWPADAGSLCRRRSREGRAATALNGMRRVESCARKSPRPPPTIARATYKAKTPSALPIESPPSRYTPPG